MRNTRWILLTGSLLLGVLLTLSGSHAAELIPGPTPPPPRIPVRPPDDYVLSPWRGMSVGVDVLVDGRLLPTVRHAGKTYLPVYRLGAEYEIRVWNHGPRRVAAVVSVDGLTVINGRPASEHDPGYVVAPYSSVVIKGWRRNMETVAAFSFEERDRSYASRVGHPENVGVIGLVAFEEMGWVPRPLLEKSDMRAPSVKEGKEVGGTGTGYGRDVDSPIYYVPFVRSGNRRSVTIYYDTAEALRRAGVPVDGTPPVPFPGDGDFVPPPPGRG